MTRASAPHVRHHDVVIVGGGNAGISLAAFLRRRHRHLDIAIVAPDQDHRYRPLLSYVGAGMARPDRTLRRQATLIPPNCTWYRDSVTRVHPARATAAAAEQIRHCVITAAGRTLSADDLVLCPGTVIDWDAIPGAREACHSPQGSSNYDPQLAPKTWPLLSSLQQGDALFAVSYRNTPCPGVGLKPLFLAADHWRRAGRSGGIQITVLVENDTVTGLPVADDRILDALARLKARVHLGARIDDVDPARRVMRATGHSGKALTVSYDALHLAPPYRGHGWVTDSGLTTTDTTLIGVDPRTLSHPAHPGLWALGDAAALDTPSSGGGLRKQVPVLAHNLRARRTGGDYRHYEGYTVAPIPLNRRRLLLAERNRRGEEERTVQAVSLAKARAATLYFDLHLQPWVYWHRLLKGKV